MTRGDSDVMWRLVGSCAQNAFMRFILSLLAYNVATGSVIQKGSVLSEYGAFLRRIIFNFLLNKS